MKVIFFFILTIITLGGAAFAQQIPDYSLSPAETARQPNIAHSTQPLNPNGNLNTNTNPYNNPNTNPYDTPAPLLSNNDIPTTGTTRYMDSYCDQNFTPAIASDSHYTAIANCLRQQRQQSCAQFQQLPDDAKRVLDQTINCTNQLLNGVNPNDPGAAAPANCGDTDASRLQLLKKYWRDPNTAYALVFLPDEVLSNSAKCMRGGL